MGLVVFSQGMISASNFAVSLFLLYFAPKTELGLYALGAGVILLGCGIQNAVLLTPLSVTCPQLASAVRRSVLGDIAIVNLVGSLLVCAIILFGALLIRSSPTPYSYYVALAFAQFGSLMREFRRTYQILEEKYRPLAHGDALMAAICAVGLGGLVLAGRDVTATSALAVIAISTFASSLTPNLHGLGVGRIRAAWSTFHKHLSQSVRWTVPGVVISWAQSNLFAYLVGLRVGVGAVGEISAARMAIAPGAVAATAWNRYYLPKLGEEFASRRTGDSLTLVRRRVYLTMAGVGIYAAAVFGIVLRFGMDVFPAGYRAIRPLIVLWLVWLLATTTRTVLSSTLLALYEYRRVAVYSAWSAAVTLCLLSTLIVPMGLPGALASLVAGEVVLGLLCLRALARIREGGR